MDKDIEKETREYVKKTFSKCGYDKTTLFLIGSEVVLAIFREKKRIKELVEGRIEILKTISKGGGNEIYLIKELQDILNQLK